MHNETVVAITSTDRTTAVSFSATLPLLHLGWALGAEQPVSTRSDLHSGVEHVPDKSNQIVVLPVQ